ncbi:MAG: DUF2971 domain-containing protein [Flavobacteriales bacterium]|nr:DUF2971 domain-containing protein [Flavobacteriales bacterium]
MLLYKYRGSQNEEDFERDFFSIEKNYFWAASSEKLNDPCETMTNSDKFIKQTGFISKLMGVKSEKDLNFLHENYRNVLSFDKKMGIYSLSQNYNDELLWAHYGNSHRGFCIEYDFNRLIESYSLNNAYNFQVKYNDKITEIGVSDAVLNKNNRLIMKMSGYKSKRWEYENEYRIITNNFGEHHYYYNAVKSIYFGLRISDFHKTEIMNRLKGRGIKYYQIEQIKNTYKFEKSAIEDINGNEITYLNQIPEATTNDRIVKYGILKYKMNSIGKIGEIEIELERKITEIELNWLAELF